MARKEPFSELDDLDARYKQAVKEAGWSPGMDHEAMVTRPPGRPRLGARRIAITLTLSPLAVDILDILSEHYHLTRGRIVDRLLENCKEYKETEEPEPKRKHR